MSYPQLITFLKVTGLLLYFSVKCPLEWINKYGFFTDHCPPCSHQFFCRLQNVPRDILLLQNLEVFFFRQEMISLHINFQLGILNAVDTLFSSSV